MSDDPKVRFLFDFEDSCRFAYKEPKKDDPILNKIEINDSWTLGTCKELLSHPMPESDIDPFKREFKKPSDKNPPTHTIK